MFIRGNAYKTWAQNTTADECYTLVVENGCHIEVRARETTSGDIEMLVCVYGTDGEMVTERIKTLPGREWTVQDALKRGIDQAERLAGGESGRLPCADPGIHDNE
jgi:hypothetical protein